MLNPKAMGLRTVSALLGASMAAACGGRGEAPQVREKAATGAEVTAISRATPHPVVAVSLSEGHVPDVVVDAAGRIHAAWVTYSNNVVYGQFRKDGELAKHPVRVNHVFGTAAGGAFRGPDLDLGEGERVHVAWYPNLEAEDQVVEPGLHYAYLDPKTTFTDARTLNNRPSDNFSLAADGRGHVEVMWTADELYTQRSEDGGETWTDPVQAAMDILPCECCGTRLHLDETEGLWALYRERAEDIRDIHVVTRRALGAEPARVRLATRPWKADVCPMSGSWLHPHSDGVVAAWRTMDEIEFARLDGAGHPLDRVHQVEGGPAGKRYPVILVADDGALLVAFKSATELWWQLYTPDGTPDGPMGSQATDNPDRAAGGALPDGTFILFG